MFNIYIYVYGKPTDKSIRQIINILNNVVKTY